MLPVGWALGAEQCMRCLGKLPTSLLAAPVAQGSCWGWSHIHVVEKRVCRQKRPRVFEGRARGGAVGAGREGRSVPLA